LEYSGRLWFASFTSVSVHVVLPVNRDVVVQPHAAVLARLEHAQHDGISDQPAAVSLQTDEDVGVADTGDRPDVLSGLDGHAIRL
jgi:hypothetical protein